MSINVREGTVGGIFYQVRESDAGLPWLVLIMGYSGSALAWPGSFVDDLTTFANVLLVDNRGTGRSMCPPDLSGFTIDLMAEDVHKVMLKAGVARAVVAGYSLGGCIAQRLLERAPELFAGLVLISTTAGGKLYTAPGTDFLHNLANPAGSTSWEKSLSIWRLCIGESQITELEPELKALYEIQYPHKTPRITFAGQMQAFRSFAASPGKIPAELPVRIISGTEDRLMPHRNSVTLAEQITHASFVEIRGCEHMPYLEAPGECTEALRSFVQDQKFA